MKVPDLFEIVGELKDLLVIEERLESEFAALSTEPQANASLPKLLASQAKVTSQLRKIIESYEHYRV